MVNDPRIVHSRLQQSRIEDRLTLVREPLRNLLAHTRAFERQIFISQSLLCELEDVPFTAGETHRLGVVTNLHGTEETRNKFGWKAVALQILLCCKADVAAGSQAVNVFTLRTRDSREVSLALKLLVDVVDLQLCISLVLGVVSDSLGTVVSGVNHDHCQRY